MRRIRKIKPNDIEPLKKLSRRVVSCGVPRAIELDDKAIESLMDNGSFSVSTEAYRVYGYVNAIHNLGEAFFPVSKSYRKQDDILELFDYKGEALLCLNLFEIDPSLDYEDEGKTILNSIIATNRETTFLVAVPQEDNEKLGFFLSCGFQNKGIIDSLELGSPHYLLIKPYIKPGLCREARW